LGRVQGLGSAKDGTGHWWAERVTSVALIPLTLWFLFSVLTLPDLNYAAVRAAYHSYLGTTVIVEDYVHAPGAKLLLTLSLKFAHVLAGGAGIFAILRVTFGS
jgi:succinate dehydrogenase / fumarate reductase membrane anchor subunit